jgi:hypothetical protein
VDALTLGPEQRQHLGRLRARAAEPVRCPGVEFGGLPGLHDEVVLTESQPQPAGQHVHPLVALVTLLIALLITGRLTARDDHLVGADPARLAGQREEGAAVTPDRPGADPRVARRRADEFVQRYLIGAGQGQQQLQGRLAAAGFQPGQRAHRDAGLLGYLGERAAAALAQRPQARADRVQDGIALHPSIATSAREFVKTSPSR